MQDNDTVLTCFGERESLLIFIQFVSGKASLDQVQLNLLLVKFHLVIKGKKEEEKNRGKKKRRKKRGEKKQGNAVNQTRFEIAISNSPEAQTQQASD